MLIDIQLFKYYELFQKAEALIELLNKLNKLKTIPESKPDLLEF